MESTTTLPTTLHELHEMGWQSKPVKRELHDNFIRMLADGEELFPGIVGYDETVIPEVNLALIAGHLVLPNPTHAAPVIPPVWERTVLFPVTSEATSESITFTDPAAPAARAKAYRSVPLAPAPNPPIVRAQTKESDSAVMMTSFWASTFAPDSLA